MLKHVLIFLLMSTIAFGQDSLFHDDSPIPRSKPVSKVGPPVVLELYDKVDGELAMSAPPALPIATNPIDSVKIVQVGDNYFGTGVLVNSPMNNQQYIVTCNHVIKDVKHSDKITYGKTGNDVNNNIYIVNKDKKWDLGILEGVTGPGVELYDRNIEIGNTVYSIGSDGKLPGKITINKHIVKHMDDGSIYTDGPYVPGRSGGGLFTKDGKLVGIFNGVLNAKDTPKLHKLQVYTSIDKLLPLLDPVQYEITGYTRESCTYCRQMHEIFDTENDHRVKVIWSTEPAPKFVLDKLPSDYKSPVMVVERTDGKFSWPEKSGVYTIDQMVEFCKNIDGKTSSTIDSDSAGAMSAKIGQERAVGAISCKTYIDQLFTYYNTYLPDGTKASFKWNRSGSEQFNLYGGKKVKLSAETLLGENGGFAFDIKYPDTMDEDAKLLVRELAFTYGIGKDGNMSFDIQRIIVHHLVTMINQKLAIATGAEQPKGFIGIMTLWTVVSVVRDIWAITHPTLDLYLGSVVSASTYQANDTIYIDFKDCPQIRIVILFNFKLSLKQLVITHKRIDTIFTGSRLIKHYGFDIK